MSTCSYILHIGPSRRDLLGRSYSPGTAAEGEVDLSSEFGDVCDLYRVDAEAVARARAAMVSEEAAARLAESFAVLGDPTRVKMISALLGSELCVCDLAT